LSCAAACRAPSLIASLLFFGDISEPPRMFSVVSR
jgi:hypothetical protein